MKVLYYKRDETNFKELEPTLDDGETVEFEMRISHVEQDETGCVTIYMEDRHFYVTLTAADMEKLSAPIDV